MAQLTINDDLYNRVAQFKQVVEAVIEESIGFDEYMALIVGRGVDSMLADILGHADQPTMLTSFQQLGSKYPAQVYAYIAEVLQTGAAIHEREQLRKKIGFTPSNRRPKQT